MFDHRCIDAVARSNHPNIAQVQDRWADQWPSVKVYIQTELCYGDLNQYIEANRNAGAQIDQTAVWEIMLDIVEGLTYAHELGWSHRNLKPRNGNFSYTKKTDSSPGKAEWYRCLWAPQIHLEDLRLGCGAGAPSPSNGRRATDSYPHVRRLLPCSGTPFLSFRCSGHMVTGLYPV